MRAILETVVQGEKGQAVPAETSNPEKERGPLYFVQIGTARLEYRGMPEGNSVSVFLCECSQYQLPGPLAGFATGG